MHKILYTLSFFFSILLVVACSNDEDFSSSVQDGLTFSLDTLYLGDVITEQVSSTHSFSIYNNNSKGLKITSAELERGVDKSGFHINISGIYVGDSYLGELEVRHNDSLRVFVNVKPQKTLSDIPVAIDDKLILTLESGRKQEIPLVAYGQDVIELKNFKVDSDTTLSSSIPYMVYDSVYIKEGATMTIKAGTRFLFRSGAGIKVDGCIKAEGTLLEPIVMRGARMDNMFVNQPYDRISGQWHGVVLGANSFGNVFNFCDIHSSDVGIDCKTSDNETEEKLRLENSIIHNTKGDGLTLRKCKAFVGNTQITNALGRCVSIYGGDNMFVHCTIGQFYPFSALRMSALFYTNELDGSVCPLNAAKFLNCIVTGYSSDEISAYRSAQDGNALFNYYFENCLLNTPEYVDAERCVNIRWDNKDAEVCREANFVSFDLPKLLFGFRLAEKSPARGAASSIITEQYYPEDINGVLRLSDGSADAGCYEFKVE